MLSVSGPREKSCGEEGATLASVVGSEADSRAASLAEQARRSSAESQRLASKDRIRLLCRSGRESNSRLAGMLNGG